MIRFGANWFEQKTRVALRLLSVAITVSNFIVLYLALFFVKSADIWLKPSAPCIRELGIKR